MPTTVYSSGPAAIIVGRSMGYGGYSAFAPGIDIQKPSILGWCERSPQIEVSGSYTPMFNTIGGVELPYTYLYQGAEGRIYCTLTKWDDYVLYLIEHLYVMGTPVAYQSSPINNRSLFVFIVYPLWVNQQVQVSLHAWANLFPVCRVERIEKKDQGTMPAKVTIVFHAIRSHVLPSLSKMPVHAGMGSMNIGAYGGFGTADASNIGGGSPAIFNVALSYLGLILANIA